MAKKGGWKGRATYPGRRLSQATRTATIKKAKKGGDIGKPGKKFKEVAAKAAKQYGSEEAGQRVAAAAMWKNLGRKARKRR